MGVPSREPRKVNIYKLPLETATCLNQLVRSSDFNRTSILKEGTQIYHEYLVHTLSGELFASKLNGDSEVIGIPELDENKGTVQVSFSMSLKTCELVELIGGIIGAKNRVVVNNTIVLVDRICDAYMRKIHVGFFTEGAFEGRMYIPIYAQLYIPK